MPCCEVPGQNVHLKLWADLASVEPAALAQLRNITALPWVFHHVAAMPDVHLGSGATVGSVIAMLDAVSPAAVGVDIGCGMGVMGTNLTANDLPDSLLALRLALQNVIPVGFKGHTDPVIGRMQGQLRSKIDALFAKFGGLSEKVADLKLHAAQQMGTLGSGNHFIELNLDTNGKVYMMLHSGSRGIGNKLATVHMERAKTLAHNADLPDPDLAVFLAGTKEMQAYRRDLYWAQEYALLNRTVMFELYKEVMRQFFPHVTFEEPILCHHNYVAEEVHYGKQLFVTRKGAIRAGVGDLGIIPGSMGANSYIVRGRGNPESFCSASHGAGRRMSRGEALRTFTTDDLKEQTKGIECDKSEGVLDEIPGAYKSIEDVMEQQSDLVEVVAQLRQVLCVKDHHGKGKHHKRGKKLDHKE